MLCRHAACGCVAMGVTTLCNSAAWSRHRQPMHAFTLLLLYSIKDWALQHTQQHDTLTTTHAAVPQYADVHTLCAVGKPAGIHPRWPAGSPEGCRLLPGSGGSCQHVPHQDPDPGVGGSPAQSRLVTLRSPAGCLGLCQAPGQCNSPVLHRILDSSRHSGLPRHLHVHPCVGSAWGGCPYSSVWRCTAALRGA